MMDFQFSHLGVVVKDIKEALAVYQEVFGYKIILGPLDDPVQKVSVCFLGNEPKKDVVIELVSPLGEDSPVSRIVNKEIGAYHICYKVNDIERVLTYVRSKGCIILNKPSPALAFKGKRIAWFYLPTHQLIEVAEI